MIKVITFDFWNTLYRDSKTAQQKRERARRKLFSAFLKRHGNPAAPSARHRAWKYANQLFQEWWERDHRSLSTQERVDLVLEQLNVRCPLRQRRSLAEAYADITLIAPPRPLTGVCDTIPRLAEKYRLAIICDTGITSGRVLRKVLAQDGLLPYFKHAVFSDEVGRTKPHCDNFHLALRKLRARPDEAVHIGDLIRTDIRGAQAAGMHAVLFTHITQYSEKELRGQAPGIPVVSDFRRIPKVIEGLQERMACTLRTPGT